MSRRSSSSTPQTRRSSAQVAPGERGQVVDQRLHRRIEAVALLELQRQAFGELAREHAGRLEGLHAQEHALDPLEPRRRGASAISSSEPTK